MNRREFVATATALCSGVILGGCSNQGEDMADIRVDNETGQEITATFVVTEASTGETVLDETRTLRTATRAEESVEFQNPVTSAGTHTVSVAVEDGPEESLDWDVPGDGEGGQDETNSLWIEIGDESIEFTRIAA